MANGLKPELPPQLYAVLRAPTEATGSIREGKVLGAEFHPRNLPMKRANREPGNLPPLPVSFGPDGASRWR